MIGRIARVSMSAGLLAACAPSSAPAQEKAADRPASRTLDPAPLISRGLLLTMDGLTLHAMTRPNVVAVAANGLGAPGGVFGNASRTGGQGAGAAASGSITGGSADLSGGTTVGAGNAERTGGSGGGSGEGFVTGAAAGATPAVSRQPADSTSTGSRRVTGVQLTPVRAGDALRRQAEKSIADGERIMNQASPADGPLKTYRDAAGRYADRIRSIARLIGRRGGEGDFDLSTIALMNQAVSQSINSAWIRRSIRESDVASPAEEREFASIADMMDADSGRLLTEVLDGPYGDSNKEIARNAKEIVDALIAIDRAEAKAASEKSKK